MATRRSAHATAEAPALTFVEAAAATSCNCSMCTKKAFIHLIVPPGDFELSSGQDALTTYTFNTGVARHRFCATCGVQPFYVPRSDPTRST